MRSPRKILLLFLLNWPTLKMKMVSSHTLLSSTDCAARFKLVYPIRNYHEVYFHPKFLVNKMSAKKLDNFSQELKNQAQRITNI